MKVLFILFVITVFLVSCDKDSTTSPEVVNADSTSAHSYNYSRDHFYFVQPEDLFETYSQEEVIAYELPSGWVNNAIKMADGELVLTSEGTASLPQLSTLRVFADDGLPYNNYNAISGYEIGNPDSIYYFDELTVDEDFVLTELMLILKISFLRNTTIGITYIQNDGTQIGNPDSTTIEVKLIRKIDQTFQTDPEYWNFQARNCHKGLVSSSILDSYDSLSLRICSLNEEGEFEYSIPDSIYNPNSQDYTYNDYMRLDVNEDGIVNQVDTIFQFDYSTIVFPFIHPFKSLEDFDMYLTDDPQAEDYTCRIFVIGYY